jgi:hypothetical protein
MTEERREKTTKKKEDLKRGEALSERGVTLCPIDCLTEEAKM